MSKSLRVLAGLALGLCLTGFAGARDVGRLPTSFAQCPSFFAGRPPAVEKAPKLRELCYDSFAILHNGYAKAPVFVAQRLNKQTLGGVPRQKGDRFFADARLPRGERAELEDYKRSGYSRGRLCRHESA